MVGGLAGYVASTRGIEHSPQPGRVETGGGSAGEGLWPRRAARSLSEGFGRNPGIYVSLHCLAGRDDLRGGGKPPGGASLLRPG
jgi:hypothetical protein